ncbi:hypothetical protein FE257_011773 [Aspergillus nanangensis]|uniref:Protein kinase domain-containing protein n=1 Tax=Aspergillus nanangensis TaxID=2582783 RepID=A0AAD4CV84_ASPNN|nr:hypothetical protein FE257_011773 [Aspergillus nanangensis]
MALDWAHRGTSHVQFQAEEAVPLEQGRFLGHGMNGGVYETTCLGMAVAWKRRYCRRQIGTQELREMDILKKLDHRHIVKLVGTYTHESFLGILLWPVATCDLGTFMEDVDHLVSHQSMQSDYDPEIDYQSMEQRLRQLRIDTFSDWPSARRAALLRLKQSIGCIASAIVYLHEQSIRHKDIKPSNILLTPTGLYVTDFGTSTDFSGFSQSVTQNGERGTPKYFAPEVAEYEPNGRSADIFSLGCVFLEMIGLCNQYSLSSMLALRPKKDRSFHANLDSIMRWFNFSGTEVQWPADQHLLALARQMLSRDPQKRPTADHIERRLHLIDAIQRPRPSTPLRRACCRPELPLPMAGMEHAGTRRAHATVEIGNWHQDISPGHSWRFFVRFPSIESIVDSVHLFLHPSFQNPYHVKTQPPYEFNGKGWGFFTITILVSLRPGYWWTSADAAVGLEKESLMPLYWTLDFSRDLTVSKVALEIATMSSG